MRSLTNFLLMETIFDSIPPTNPKISSFASRVLSPSFKIVEDDCGTRLGRVISLGASAVGRVSLFSYGTFSYQTSGGTVSETIEMDDILTESKVTALLTNQSTVATRSISTCTSTNGLCRKCIRGSFPELYPTIVDVPPIGESFRVNPPRKVDYLTYLTETHTGGLLGFKSLGKEGDAILPVREELIRSKIQDGELAQIFREVSNIPSVDAKFVQYASNIDDKLEKALFLILMYGFFINVRI